MHEEFPVTFAEASECEMKERESARTAAERERALFHPRPPSHFHSCDVKMNPSLSISCLVPTAKTLKSCLLVSMFQSA